MTSEVEAPHDPPAMSLVEQLGPAALVLLLPGLAAVLFEAFVLRWAWWIWLVAFVIVEVVTFRLVALYEKAERVSWLRRQRGTSAGTQGRSGDGQVRKPDREPPLPL